MTLVSDIITDAFRRSNLLALGQVPDINQGTEALRYLNRIVKSVFGNEVGEKLEAFPIGRHNISRPAGYPWWNNVPDNNFYFPPNVRAIMNLDGGTHVDLYLHPDPPIGCRFAYNFMDPGSGQSATIHGNGRYITGLDTINLDGTVTEAEYLYRDDLANWVQYAPIIATDTFPFPSEFDDFFITALAMVVNPAYGQILDPQSQSVFKRSAQQIRSRYHQVIPTRSELGLIRLTRTAADRDLWGNIYWLYNPSDMFAKGWPW